MHRDSQREEANPKIIVVIGAYPDIGKGIFTASVSYLLKKFGLMVSPLKFDGYFNYNSGSMNPYHRKPRYLYTEEEVFVLKDGFEADADSGYYERFLNEDFTATSNLTNGQVYHLLTDSERTGHYPPGEIIKTTHARDIILDWIETTTRKSDVSVLEIGGTVADKESAILYDGLRVLKDGSRAKIVTILLSPYFSLGSQQDFELSSRTKITRNAFLAARELGLTPDLVVLRTDKKGKPARNDIDYIAQDCNLENNSVFVDPTCDFVYELPQKLENQGLVDAIASALGLKITNRSTTDILKNYCSELKSLVEHSQKLRVGIFGKTSSCDSFVSLREAVDHAAVGAHLPIEVIWLDDAEDVQSVLRGLDALIIAEGLTSYEEKIKAIAFAERNALPILGISFGYDLGVAAIAQSRFKKRIPIEELDNQTRQASIKKVPLEVGQTSVTLEKPSHTSVAYGKLVAKERYRHQSWPSQQLIEDLSQCLTPVGIDQNGNPAVLELKQHPFFILVKYHPEFTSRPAHAHPLFVELLKAAKNYHGERKS